MEPQRRLAILGFVGVLLAVLLIGPLLATRRPSTRSPVNDASDVTTSDAPDAKTLAAPHLDSAAAETQNLIEDRVIPVETFFRESKKNTRQFAKLALGFGSKWRLIADRVPFTQGGRHETYIREQFEASIFSATQLEQVVTTAIAEYLADVRSVENQMLVSLRADIAGFPDAYPIASLDDSELQAKFDEAIAAAIAAAGDQVQAEIGTQLISLIGGEVLTQVALRMGISAGILGVGAASGWATLGIGVVVGLIVDQIVSWVWDWWADPTGDLAASLNAKINEVSRLICDGDSNNNGLRQRFRELANNRARIREVAILELLSSGQVSNDQVSTDKTSNDQVSNYQGSR
jgi:hypothetical protein